MNKILHLLDEEQKRQKNTLMMIPSENLSYPEVRSAVGSCLMHKYSEGQAGKRYYQGNKVIDEIEKECKKLSLSVFGLSDNKWGANVQSYSGSIANLAVYNALIAPKENILSMYLPDGGHLSHGWQIPGRKVTLVSKIWNVNYYHVDEKTRIFDYEKIARRAANIRPKLIISGGTAYPREINHKKMGEIAKSVGAFYLADIAHEAGLIAAKVNSSPFPYADVVSMTTQKTLRGPRGAIIIFKKELAEKINKSVFPGIQGGPHNHTIAGIAISLQKTKLTFFKKYTQQTVNNAKYLSELLLEKGYDVVSGGTDKHLLLIDLRNKKNSGWFAAWALEKAGIIVNRNSVPFDKKFPFYPSGIRLGTPAITARGMKEEEILKIADWIDKTIVHIGQREIPKEERKKYLQSFLDEIRKDDFFIDISIKVKQLCKKFPIT